MDQPDCHYGHQNNDDHPHKNDYDDDHHHHGHDDDHDKVVRSAMTNYDCNIIIISNQSIDHPHLMNIKIKMIIIIIIMIIKMMMITTRLSAVQ